MMRLTRPKETEKAPNIDQATPGAESPKTDHERPDPGAFHGGAADFVADGLADDASHFWDEAEAPEIDAKPAPKLMGEEAFFMLFCTGFAVPNQAAAALKAMGRPVGPFPLQSLPIAPHEKDAARAASDALYQTLAEVPALHWMLAADGKWMGRLIAIGMFGQIKVSAVRAELAARRPVEGTSRPVDRPDAAETAEDFPDTEGEGEAAQ